jgi:rod shape-determining protein MreC
VSLTDKAKVKAKRNPTWLLGLLLATHVIIASINRAPGQPDISILRAVAITLTTPFQAGLSHGSGYLSGIWYNYFSMRDARQENATLKEERAELQKQLLQERDRVKQLEQLNTLTGWQTEHNYQGVTARVVGRDAIEWFSTIIIDKGTTSGITRNQPVVTSDGLVGRVVLVTPISAQVLLITDQRHGTGAIVVQTVENRLLGVVKGRGRDRCEIAFFTTPDKIENGEAVITSGQDGIYPKGLLIGRVRKPEAGPEGIGKAIEVDPAAPFGKLEIVSVLNVTPEQIRQAIDEVEIEEKKQEKAPDRSRGDIGRY